MVQPLPYKDLKFETVNREAIEGGEAPVNPPTLEGVEAETEKSRTRESCRPTSGTTSPPTSETSSEERRSAESRTVTLEQILNTSDEAETGYFCEVDLEFPPELHDKFNSPMPRKFNTEGWMV